MLDVSNLKKLQMKQVLDVVSVSVPSLPMVCFLYTFSIVFPRANVFSYNLDFQKVLVPNRMAPGEGEIRTGGEPSKALNMVIKLYQIDGNYCVKISDEVTKVSKNCSLVSFRIMLTSFFLPYFRILEIQKQSGKLKKVSDYRMK